MKWYGTETMIIPIPIKLEKVNFGHDKVDLDSVNETMNRVRNAIEEDPSVWHQAGVPTIIYRTMFHDTLYRRLIELANGLNSGLFKDQSGPSSKLLAGARGVGKTTCLRAFCSVIPTLYPNMLSFFISFTSGGSKVCEYGSLCSLICKKLFPNGCEDDDDDDERQHVLIRFLRKTDKRLFLFIDELDQLYTCENRDNEKSYVTTLGELASLANDTSGCVAIVVSGSSIRLSKYVERKMEKLSEKESQLPVLKSSPSLNGSRFKTLCIPVPQPDDIGSIRDIVKRYGNLSDDMGITMKCRKAMFYCGTNPRKVVDFCMAGTNDQVENVTLPDPTTIRFKFFLRLLGIWCGENIGLISRLCQYKKNDRWEEQWESTQTNSDKCAGFKPATVDQIGAMTMDSDIEIDYLCNDGLIIRIDNSIWPQNLALVCKCIELGYPTTYEGVIRQQLEQVTRPEEFMNTLKSLTELFFNLKTT